MITNTKQNENQVVQGSLFVARQPIFDRKKDIWGYELLFRNCETDKYALILDPVAATASIIADGFIIGSRGLEPGKTICINFSLKTLLDSAALALPRGMVCLEIPASEAATIPQEQLSMLKENGYTLSLDNYQGQDLGGDYLQMADIIKISFSDNDPRKIMQIRSKLKAFKSKLAAMKLEDWAAYEGAKALGFQLFQGYFFSQPEILSGRKVPSGKISRLRLLQKLYAEDLDVEQFVRLISSDPALVYRLMRYINSPGFGLISEIISIKHAVNLLGLTTLKHWATAAIIADIDSSDKGAELSWLAIQRAFFLQRAAERGFAKDFDPESMFLLGLFSTLDSLMGMTMDQVLAELPLEPWLKSALTGQDEQRSPWISMLEHLENGSLEKVQDSLSRLAMPSSKAAALYMEAGKMTYEALHGSENNPNK